MNILSIDIEEIFHTEYACQYRRHHLDYRTPYIIRFILQLLKAHNTKATFFIVGEIAKKFPNTIKMIIEEEHEVAFHGWSHIPLWKLNPDTFRQEILRFKEIHPTCIGYRAPSFSLNNRTRWALKILSEEKFHYDSSIFPAWTPLYGVYGAPSHPYKPSLDDVSKEDENNYGIIEFPLAVYRLFGLKIPISGGFWLRLWNIELMKKLIRKLNEKGFPAILYIHSWELDSRVPKLKLNPYKSFVTYHNIRKAIEKTKSLLQNFQFTSFREYLESEGMF